MARIDYKWMAIIILCIASFIGFTKTSDNDKKIEDNSRADLTRVILIQRQNCMETNEKIVTFLHDFAAIATNPQAVQVLNDEADKFQAEDCA